MSEEVHRRIAELALECDFIDSSDMASMLLELGRRLAAGIDVDVDIWVDEEWLEPVELTEVLDQISLPLDPSEEESGSSSADDAYLDAFARAETKVRQQTDDWSGEKPQTGEPEPHEARERVREPIGESAPGDRRDSSPNDTLTGAPVQYFDELESPDDSPSGGGESSETGEVDPEGLIPESALASIPPADGGESEVDEDLSFDSVVRQATGASDVIDSGERFVLKKEIGSGGSGRVVRAFDRVLGRMVAMKILYADTDSDPNSLARFIAESRATGQLEHPNIVPIYDFGVLPSGDAFYTMREVQGHSLRKVLNRLQDGDEEYRDEYTLVRLLNILRQVSQATNYAHVRSVIHRDLKPDNIMLGDFGEVLVMDWGLAQIIESKADFGEGSAPSSSGQTLGTPSYMPPEQARGDLERVNETSDIYSLGAILYEILTFCPPFSGDGPLDIMWAVVDSDVTPPSKRAPSGRDVPEELERICLKAMSKQQERRYSSAREFHDDIEAWLEGLKPREASRLVDEGKEAAERYHDLLSEIEDYKQEVRFLSAQIDDWEGTEAKKELWEVEDERDEVEAESARAFCQAVTKFTQALAHEPTSTPANQGLADLYWTRLRRAEMRRDIINTIYFKTLVEQYDPGTYEDLLEAHADLRVSTDPDQASITLFNYEEEERRLVPKAPRELGDSPTQVDALPIGSYLVKLDHDKCRKIQQPVFIERDRDAQVHVRLPDESQFQEGFRYVPGGKYISGGDPEAFNPRRPTRVHVPPFFCQTHPVTFGDYLEWFNELYDELGDEAMVHAPQTREAEGLLIQYDEDDERWAPDDVLIEGKARERYPEGEGYEYELPVLGIRVDDAREYIAWRSEQDGRDYRLPTVHEYEKAGRGVDGRRFPWGNQFDATYCKMRFSRPEKPPQPEPVCTFEPDRSPYGIRDLAGGAQEWCQSEESHEGHNPTKGGGWGQDQRLCHLASTVDVLAEARTARISFRLVYTPDFDES